MPQYCDKIVLKMEVIGLYHYCLLFQFNRQRYLFGATSSLSQDPSALRKLKAQFIILPSQPYHFQLGIYQWHLQILTRLGVAPVLLTNDNYTRKRIEDACEGLNLPHFKWQLLPLHEIKEGQLEDLFRQELAKNVVLPLRKEPYGLGMNQGWGVMSMIVSERGRGIWLVHQSEIVCIDPPQQIEAQMTHYGLPLSCLKAILLTSPHLNCFELILKMPRLTIIAEEKVYNQLIGTLKTHTCIPEQTLESVIRGKIIKIPSKQHQYRGYKLALTRRNHIEETISWDIAFGQHLVRLYPVPIDFFPPEIIHNHSLNYLILYDIQDNIKHELQRIPQVYRKKIIYNRVDRKYNNKYFLTLQAGNQTITLPPVKKYPQPPQDLSFAFKEEDQRGQLQSIVMKGGEAFNSSQRIVYVRKGYVRDGQGKLYPPGSVIVSSEVVRSEGIATIMYQTHSECYFYQGSRKLPPSGIVPPDDLLKKVRENSLVKEIIQVCQRQEWERLGCLERHSLEKQGKTELQFGVDSLWWRLNRICTARTFQSGEEYSCGNNLYLIIKGCLKLRGEEALASKQMGLGSIRPLYCEAYNEEKVLDVVKDTWALQIPVASLHKELLSAKPEILYGLFIREVVFE